MFMNSLKLGFRDIWRFKKVFCLMLALITLSGILLVAGILPCLDMLKEQTSAASFSLIPISYVEEDSNEASLLLDKLGQVYQQGGASFFSSEHINKKFDTYVQILFYHQAKDVVWAIPKEDAPFFLEKYGKEAGEIQEMDTVKLEAELSDLGYGKENLMDTLYIEPQLLFKISDPGYHDLRNYRLTFDEILTLVDSTYSGKRELNEGWDHALEEVFSGSSFYVKKNIYSGNQSELLFLSLYYFPYIFFLTAAVCIMFYIFSREMYRIMQKEYAIHLLSGAQKRTIFLRNTMFNIALLGTAFLILHHRNSFRISFSLWFKGGLTLALLLLFEGILLSALKNEDFLSHL